MELSPAQQSRLLDLARMTIRRSLGEVSAPVLDGFEQECRVAAGCFVTLHTIAEHRLRGCIGQLSSTEPLTETVADMARSVLRDPRFASQRVTLDELGELEIELTILSPLEPAGSVTDFDLLNDGIYLHCQGETGCFLPQVARETGWDKATLLGRLCSEKMGLVAACVARPVGQAPEIQDLHCRTRAIYAPAPVAQHRGGPAEALSVFSEQQSFSFLFSREDSTTESHRVTRRIHLGSLRVPLCDSVVDAVLVAARPRHAFCAFCVIRYSSSRRGSAAKRHKGHRKSKFLNSASALWQR